MRDLAERGVLRGRPGAYKSTAEVAEVTVPATLQAAIAARIDRLEPEAKQTLNAAAVDRLTLRHRPAGRAGDEPGPRRVGQGRTDRSGPFHAASEYAFRHPLIRAVAYESQLKSDRAQLHRRLAAAIESG